jgi:signal transduction histidine kinase
VRAALRRALAKRGQLENACAAAAAEERRRIAREIHDTVAQALTGIIIQLRNADAALGRGFSEVAQKDLQLAMAFAHEGLGEARRCVHAWRTEPLTDGSFSLAAERLVRRMTSGSGLSGVWEVAGNRRELTTACEKSMLRILQESLTNVLRHAQASRFSATLRFEQSGVRLLLRDDGCGFHAARTDLGFGLLGMKERVGALGGQLTISSAVGQGTTILVSLPDSCFQSS